MHIFYPFRLFDIPQVEIRSVETVEACTHEVVTSQFYFFEHGVILASGMVLFLIHGLPWNFHWVVLPKRL